MSTIPEATRHNNSTKLLVLSPLRDNSKSKFQCETPCRPCNQWSWVFTISYYLDNKKFKLLQIQLYNAGCDSAVRNWIGDGFCDDQNNNGACNFDGGDCCGSNITTLHCSECICFGNFSNCSASLALIGNGFCNNEANTQECIYDGGDCCGPAVSCKRFFIDNLKKTIATLSYQYF